MCISERTLFLLLVADTIGQVCTGPAGLQLQLCAPRSLEGRLAAREGASCFPGRIPSSCGQVCRSQNFCFPELAWDGARKQLSQSLAHSRWGEHHTSSSLLRVASGLKWNPRIKFGQLLGSWCCGEGHMISASCFPQLLSNR